MNVASIANRLQPAYSKAASLAPVRPTVVIHTDDWGRVGVHEPEAIERLRLRGIAVGASKWDYYGRESAEDLQSLGSVLGEAVDVDGRPACMTANMVMANADIRRMRQEGFRDFRFVPIGEGLPSPWEESSLIGQYQSLIAARLFYAGLHGFTHFSPQGMLRGWHDSGELGKRTRALLSEDIPYLASVTPEFNFALVDRTGGGEAYADAAVQSRWVEQGVGLFRQAFGHAPMTTCAPGYRCNDATLDAWAEHGMRVFQITGTGGLYESGGMLAIERNVPFEPLLDDERVVQRALSRIRTVVNAGLVAVICSHSINYITRYCAGRDRGLKCLADLLRGIRQGFPDVRFAHDADLMSAFRNRDKDWFRKPRLGEVLRRLKLRAGASAEYLE